MKYLVTGASGFIGRATCQALVARGDEVVALVRSSAFELPGLQVVHAELADEDRLRQALVGVDCVVHLAGRAHLLADDAADPLAEFRAVNRDATLRLAALAREAGVRRFVFMSSIGVNGSHTQGEPFCETSPVAPRADYALSKLEAEQGLIRLLGSDTMEWVIIRPPLVYAAQAPGNFQRLLKLVASGMPLPFGWVRNRRNMVALDDLVSFILLSSVHARAANQLYLVADAQAVSTQDIVVSLAQGMGRKVINLPVPPILLRLGLAVLGKTSLYTQLCGSLEVDAAKARELGWVSRSSAQQSLIAVGQGYRLK
ncbi:UDP-glucose 4-epimerase [Pseudomonas reidholzensis]|uniref:UDP-glucose 4-epimerase n=1 Tax=Pseudomonas reidholzensis TaxID=1785162 RepID=A0A383RQV6_9PSED|nr:NAD-dependent epimerase/dehydratase family protein [Pseudomonas reidholzensis]SYX89432.1 UDP-glucose 4-epimerase [Pseudomonas reidholzensis]